MPPSFAVACEGKTDFPVLKNILIGKFKADGVEPAVNRHHPKEDGFGGWESIFRYLRGGEHIDALERANYLIIQIDTDAADEHPNYGVTARENGEALDVSTLVVRVTEKLRSLIGEKDTVFYGDRILFAVCVRELECWLLPLWDSAKKAKTTGCFDALNTALSRGNERTLSRERKDPRRYDEISKGYRKRKDLEEKGSANPSLAIFLTNLERCSAEEDWLTAIFPA